MAAATCWPKRADVLRSSPKILTAMFARVPESMWSMRWEMGCPTVTFVPGRSVCVLADLFQHCLFGRSRMRR